MIDAIKFHQSGVVVDASLSMSISLYTPPPPAPISCTRKPPTMHTHQVHDFGAIVLGDDDRLVQVWTAVVAFFEEPEALLRVISGVQPSLKKRDCRNGVPNVCNVREKGASRAVMRREGGEGGEGGNWGREGESSRCALSAVASPPTETFVVYALLSDCISYVKTTSTYTCLLPK